LHLRVICSYLLAGLGAAITCIGTESASLWVKRRVAQHKVLACETGLRTVEQRLNVAGLRMLASLLETVRDRLNADGMAVFAVLNALLHGRTHLIVLHHLSFLKMEASPIGSKPSDAPLW